MAEPCALCGEQTREGDVAEMYDPNDPLGESQIVHPECGLQKGWVVA
jgi:hypothetical protein